MKLIEQLKNDVRIQDALHHCIQCGTCSAICPAASFYQYDPRLLTIRTYQVLHTDDEEGLKNLLSSDFIWYCGECMSCKTRCPRNNTPGIIVEALRSLSQDSGLFVESEKGRQQLMIKRTIGEWILQYGYCVVGHFLTLRNFPEQGPNWQWILENIEMVFQQQNANYQQPGTGPMRKVPDEALQELKNIFELTGAMARFHVLESMSEQKAKEMNLEFDQSHECAYFRNIYEGTTKITET